MLLRPRRWLSAATSPPLALLTAALLFLSACGTARIAEPVLPEGQAEPARALETNPGYQYLLSPSAEAEARRRLTTLAADAMAGREATTEGERLAAAFIVDELEGMGVAPGGDLVDGARTYFQTFPLRTGRFDFERTRFGLADGPDSVPGDDWVALIEQTPEVNLNGVPLVFAGYGISAPDQGYDDYAGLDVTGKVVLVAPGKPAGVDSVAGLQGKLAADDFLPKLIGALQRRAAAVAIISDPAFAAESWDLYRSEVLGTSMEPPGGQLMILPAPTLFIHPDYAVRLFDAFGMPADVLDRAEAGQPLPALGAEQSVNLTTVVSWGTAEARNVVGVLPGDEQPDEFVAFGAHYDHVGTIGGEIYNGADDDASGVTAVLAVAQALAADADAGNAPDRSSLFVFHTAEEKGLYGSEFFADNPGRSVLADIDRVVAQVNLDMVAREHPDSLYVVGASRLSTTFGRRVNEINASLGDGDPLFTFDFTYDDPDDPENLYERSDHYNYAKHGVPVVFLTDGMGANWAKGLPRDDYHKPDDDAELIDYAKLVRVARLAYALGRATADTDARPEVDQPVESVP